jgi:hypothetical protein
VVKGEQKGHCRAGSKPDSITCDSDNQSIVAVHRLSQISCANQLMGMLCTILSAA